MMTLKNVYIAALIAVFTAGCSDESATISGSDSGSPSGGGSEPQAVCGDGIISDDEECDDRNTDSGDGCAADCKVESGWNCPKAGEKCINTEALCGNSQLDRGEECDDGDTDDGDGCSADCKVESGWSCQEAGEDCSLIPESCGNRHIDPGEECDDGDRNVAFEYSPEFAQFTCSKSCHTVHYCGDGRFEDLDRANGEECDDTYDSSNEYHGCSRECKIINVCGDGHTTHEETCDDGNTDDGDGCSSACQLEPGYYCEDGKACVAKACGDGIVAGDEECDDGNRSNNDGCTSSCRREAGFACPEAGKPCHKTVCGDGIVEGDEQCDEGTNKTNGCSDTCRINLNWQCLIPGKACTNDAVCGDGILQGGEECDDGNAIDGDGCTKCTIDLGFSCSGAPSDCKKGRCGDGILQKGEACDDGNNLAGDGCDPTCTVEPIFICSRDGRTCRPICGDGATMWMLEGDAKEECDDGNLINGDGCSSTCRIEPGFKCTDFKAVHPDSIELPSVHYDFQYNSITGTGDGFMTQAFIDELVGLDSECKKAHFAAGRGYPDFQHFGGSGCDGMVYDMLDSEGKPVLKTPMGKCTAPNASTAVSSHVTCGQTYKYWYRSREGINRPVHKTMKLLLKNAETDSYSFAKSDFTPINGEGYGISPNGGFTTELSTYFQYKGGETLKFAGNDDVWVFLNGKLFVDLGGMQGFREKSNTLASQTDAYGNTYDPAFKVYKGGIYQMKLFHAERMYSGSDFNLELSGFINTGIATCSPICGDGITVSGEACDDGVNDGKYGGCNPGCQALAPHCGDGIVQNEYETCDEGPNNGKPGSTCNTLCLKLAN